MSTDKRNLQQFRDGLQSEQEAEIWLEASQMVADQGNLDEARDLAQAAAQAEPDNPDAWLQLARLAQDPEEQKEHLNQVLALEPEHPQAQAEMDRLARQSPAVAASSSTDRSRMWSWILGALAVVAGLLLIAVLVLGAILASQSTDIRLPALLATSTPTPIPTPTLTPGEIAAQFVPQLQEALDNPNWDRALEIVDIMQAVDPAGEETRKWSMEIHLRYGQALVEDGQVDKAQKQFDLAAALAPRNRRVLRWQQTTQLYLVGERALEAGGWETAIRSFSLALDKIPDYGDLPARLVEAYRRQGQAAMEDGDWTGAIEALGHAYERAPEDPEVAGLLSGAYRGQGQAAMEDGRWAEAIAGLTEGHDMLADDAEVVDLLASAYRQRGIIREESGNLTGARADLEAALSLRPDDAEAKAHLGRVMYRLFPPKRIEIDISRQRFYAWEGDTLVYNFPTSTGLPGRDTAAGHYQVLDKIPMAYSSIWRLQMPYWLGIYWVGNVENGIHALPIRPDGSVMWGGLLGQRASYGCVILSTSAARLIYNWADIGTPVDIHY